MATGLSSNRLPFYTLLEDLRKTVKSCTVESLLALADRKNEGSIASNGAFTALTGEHSVAPGFQAYPLVDKVRSKTVIVINFSERLILIGGTRYAGEIKKSIFTVLNYLLPRRGVLPMHCSANRGPNGDTALFFGLSGTGKTTLSADPDRFDWR